MKTKHVMIGLSSLLLIGLAWPLLMAAEGDMKKTAEDSMTKAGDMTKAAEDGMKKPNEMMKPAKECTMEDMQKYTMQCTMNGEKCMKDTSEVMVLLDEAVKAIDAGNTAEAKKNIEKATLLLKDMQMAQKTCMDKMPTVNDRCPISVKKIDMMNTPENLTKMYKGKKVGFCCPACAPAWEKLTDKEKEQKLEAAMPAMPEKTTPMKTMTDETRKRMNY